MEVSFSSEFKFDTKEIINSFEKIALDPSIGFYDLPNQEYNLGRCLNIFKKFPKKKNFVLIGIGGSSLGAQMLLDALGNKEEKNFYFLCNIDPDQIFETLEKLSTENTLFMVVSKSGGTAETLALLSIIMSWLRKKKVLTKAFRNHLVFCTDPKLGELRELGKKLGVDLLDIPENVGGRYSVLTQAGIFPALFGNLKISELLAGAGTISNNLESVAKVAIFLMENLKKGYSETVLMPYSSKLRSFTDWFVQLWAESLGKQGRGLTPISSYGATDQHSQLQLFMEGPKNKVIIFLEVQKFSYDFSLSNKEEGHNFQMLSPFTLAQLMQAELEGTLKALKDAERPFVRIKMEKLDEKNLGLLILFFESLTVMMAIFLQINPFDQPGVEAGKKNALDFLQKLRR